MLRRMMMAGGPPSGTDDFSSNTLGQYTIYRDSGSGGIGISGGTLNFTVANGSQAIAARTGAALADCELTAVVTEAQDTGLAFRISNVSNYYVAVIYDQSAANPAQRSTVALYRRSAGTFSQIGTTTAIPTFTRGTPQELKIVAVGSSIDVIVNGVLRISGTDSTHASGLHGPRSNAGPGKFDSYSWGPA